MQDQTGIPPPKSGHSVKSDEEVANQGLVVNCQPVLRFNLQKRTCLASESGFTPSNRLKKVADSSILSQSNVVKSSDVNANPLSGIPS